MPLQKKPESLSEAEQLSALLDDELPEWEARQGLARAKADPAVWARLTSQQAALNGLPQADLLAGIQQQLDEDASPANQARRARRKQWAGFLQGAVAAGVIAALSVTFWPAGDGAAGRLPPPQETATLGVPGATDAAPRVQQYWSQHARYASYGNGGARWDEVERGGSAL